MMGDVQNFQKRPATHSSRYVHINRRKAEFLSCDCMCVSVIQGSIDDIAKDFQNLTHYCANDCEATFEVYVKVDKYVWRGQGRMEMG
jgi:hypothetical protein